MNQTAGLKISSSLNYIRSCSYLSQTTPQHHKESICLYCQRCHGSCNEQVVLRLNRNLLCSTDPHAERNEYFNCISVVWSHHVILFLENHKSLQESRCKEVDKTYNSNISNIELFHSAKAINRQEIEQNTQLYRQKCWTYRCRTTQVWLDRRKESSKKITAILKTNSSTCYQNLGTSGTAPLAESMPSDLQSSLLRRVPYI